MPIFVDQNRPRIPKFTTCLDYPIKDLNIFKSKNYIDLEKQFKFCIDLLEFLYASNRKFVRQLLEPIFTGNSRQTLRNQVIIYDSASLETNYRMKCIIFLLRYFIAARKSPESEIIRKFGALKQNSITNLMNDVRFEILCSNIQKVDLKDTGIGSIFKCFKHVADICFVSKFEMLTRTERNIHSTFAECKPIMPVLELDDTKSSKGYADKECESSTHEINGMEKIISSSSKCIITDMCTNSDDFTAIDFDNEANFKIATYGYDDDNYIGMCELSDSDSGDDRLQDDGDSYAYTRGLSTSSDDVFNIYNDDEFKGVFDNCILDEISAVPFLPKQLSPEKREPSFLFQCFENPCFEDDPVTEENSYIKMVNNNWKITMEGVPEGPRESTKVSFVPSPSLVTIRHFECEDDGYSYSTYLIDQKRFQSRIQNFETIIAPFLTLEHREHILHRNNSSIC